MALEEQLDAWAKGYLEAERLPCLAVAVTQGNEVTPLTNPLIPWLGAAAGAAGR